MGKITLGQRPKTITRVVKATLPDGSEGAVTINYTYRTRTEFGALIDEVFGGGKEQTADTMAALSRQSVEANADYIMRIVEGWNLDDEFARPAVVQLCDEMPGVALAIMSQYREAVSEGRLGN